MPWPIATFLIVISSSYGVAATYYVSPSGSNAANGSATSPWESLQYAADQVSAGDRVIVRPGDYVGFHLTRSGVADSRIEFLAEPGARVTARNGTTPDGINLEGASYVTIDGFEVIGMPRAGVRTVGPYVGGQQAFAEFVTIRNTISRDNTVWGILTGFVDDLLIEGNRTSNSAREHGIYVGNSGDRPIIRNNTSFGNRANGIHVNADVSSGLDGVIEEAHIDGNVIYDNGVGGGSGINLDGVRNSVIENNLIYNAHASGISLYRIDGAEPSSGNVVANNTIHQANDGRWALNLQNGSTDTTIANNILISDHSSRGAIDISQDSLTGTVSDYNVMISRLTTNGGGSILTLPQWQTQTGLDSNSLVATADELFVDATAGDYRLREGSPARDAGWNQLAPAADLEGTPRPQGAVVDIGAYEAPVSIPGDYNSDGVIDAADYTSWRDAVGQPAGTLPNDVDGGVIGPAQYATWQANYGSGVDDASTRLLGSLGHAPEPTTAALLWLGLAMASHVRRRQP